MCAETNRPVVVAADHAGAWLKDQVVSWLRGAGREVLDLGTHGEDPVDYPDVAADLGRALQRGDAPRGVLVCGSGAGACIAANKLAGVRAAVCHDTYTAHQAVEHDDANVLCLGARVVGPALAEDIVGAWLGASFSGEDRHRRRLAKVMALEADAGEAPVGAGEDESPPVAPGVRPLAGLGQLGQAVWFDSISREWLDDGRLEAWIRDLDIVGLTSNPTIFAAALRSPVYADDVRRLAAEGLDDRTIFERLEVDDIRRACDLLTGAYERSGGIDGMVSIELEPDLADDTDASVARGQHLWRAVDRPNLMVKVPATEAGLPAIEELLVAGVNVNVTLLFAVSVYQQVQDRYLRALERRREQGMPLDVASVASFFVSRVDSKVDKALVARGDAGDAGGRHELAGTIAVANARLAWQAHADVLASERWRRLAAAGARPQRPLWASTGTKDPAYSDVLYVQELVTAGTVNTMPHATMQAFADHGEARVTITPAAVADARRRVAALADLGIDLDAVTAELRSEGVAAFAASFDELLETVASTRAAVAAPAG